VTLADILSSVGLGGGAKKTPPPQPLNDRRAFLDYTETVMVAGGSPLSYEEWVKAGRPSK